MIAYFETTIKPLNKKLIKQLDIKKIHVSSYTKTESISVQYKDECGFVRCNHDGAESSEISREMISNDELIEFDSPTLVCDKCNAWSDGSGEWYE